MTRYPDCRMLATATFCFVLMLVAGCVSEKPQIVASGKPPAPQLAPAPKISPPVQALMNLALEQGDTRDALAGLEHLAGEAKPPLNEEAKFRRVQLLLRIDDGQAMAEAEKLLSTYPGDALIPYLHVWIAQWAEEHRDDAMVLAHTAAALMHPRLTREIAGRAVALGTDAARRSPDRDAVRWFLEVARSPVYAVKERRDRWLREAAARASIPTIARLRHKGLLRGTIGEAFYLDAARVHLMMGNIAAVQTLSTWLEEDFPHTNETSLVASWTTGTTHQVNIGILLPLTGKYAHFGIQALRGMRLALDSLQDNGRITLDIADTKGDPDQCISAYQQLTNDGVTMILGPLLGGCVEALIPRLRDNIPVLSLTNRSGLAPRSPALFVHTLALTMQARFMADRAWRQGEHHIVMIDTNNASSKGEANAFIQTFEALGGEVTDHVELPDSGVDFRSDLRAMRKHTDNEELLSELDEELALSIEPDMEIRMPVNFDAVYLALPGKQVALLAGQLAYVGVNGVNLYGSSRWRDGKLLSDRGRYLGLARFSGVSFPRGASPNSRQFMLKWREIWGVGKPGTLVGLAYDSTLIATLLTSRLGLSGHDLLAGLHDKSGFPGLTGHVRFDEKGIGHKDFELFRIRRGHIVSVD